MFSFDTPTAVSAATVRAMIPCLRGLAGFVSFTAPNGHERLTALPTRQWLLPADRDGFDAAIASIRKAHTALQQDNPEGTGAIAGSLFYEAGGHCVSGFSSGRKNHLGLGFVALYHWQLELDITSGTARLLVHRECPPAIALQLEQLLTEPPARQDMTFRLEAPFQATQTAAAYRTGVQKVLELITAGDCYQVNLSQTFTTRYSGEPYFAYERLCEAIPVPHGAYVNAGDYQILSISPELFLDIREGRVTSKPIKGTRPRHADPVQDQAVAAALQAHPKDRAENLMIVDLIRNDLSRFCEPFSVKVPQLFEIESYRNVHQLVSTVSGELYPGTTALDALLSAFPGGSITGAPKRRAMEVIESLERFERGPYCGSVFWWGGDDSLQSNIAIRTLMTEAASGTVHCWAGCGIVADSDPEEEYQESLSKVSRLMQTLERLGDAPEEEGPAVSP